MVSPIGQLQKHEVTLRGEGICPKCGGLGTYVYEFRVLNQGPSDKELIEVKYVFTCMVCDFKEETKILIPFRGLYSLRYLLPSELRVFLEKVRISRNTLKA
jgi:hypothetical protein